MTLPDSTLDRLKPLLKAATALVVGDGRPVGSAVFVSPDLLLTCEHVVRRAGLQVVRPFDGRPPVDVTLACPASEERDLALLRLDTADVDPDQACAALGRGLVDGRFSISGFPREDGASPGLELRDVSGGARLDVTSGVEQMLQLAPGTILTLGNIGGPVLSHETGAVVALVRSSRHTDDALGGSAVPVAVAAEVFDDVARLLKDPPVALRPWRDALGRGAWASLGHAWDLDAQVELVVVQGAGSSWTIGVEEPPIGRVKDQVGDLGSDIGDALFRWAQRQRIREDDEVRVLGRLLAGALFPPAFAQELARLRGADRVVVRVNIPSGSSLADIPWELCTVPGTQDRFLAADDDYLLVRTLADPTDRVPGSDRTDDVVRVAAVVALPTTWEYPVVYGDDRYGYPSAGELAEGLVEAVAGNQGGPLRAQPLVNPRPGDIRATYVGGEPARFGIFHLMGVGRTSRDDRVQVALVNERDLGDSRKVGPKWESLETVLAAAVDAGATVAVLQFLLPSVDARDEPVTL